MEKKEKKKINKNNSPENKDEINNNNQDEDINKIKLFQNSRNSITYIAFLFIS